MKKFVFVLSFFLVSCLQVQKDNPRVYQEIEGQKMVENFSVDDLDLQNVEKWKPIRASSNDNVMGLEGYKMIYVFYRNIKDPKLIIMLIGEGKDFEITYLQRAAIQYESEVLSIIDRYQDTNQWYEWSVDGFCEQHPMNKNCMVYNSTSI